jgi:hypothetical protein
MKNNQHNKYATLFGLIICFALYSASCFSATYYNETGTKYCNNTADWTTNASGAAAGTPANFSTPGDIFIVRASSVMDQNANWTVGAGVTVMVYGELQNDGNTTMTFNGTLNVQNGGILRIVNSSGLNLGLTATFGASSTVIFQDGANFFDPRYTYGNLTFNDGTSNPSMGAVYPLQVQGNMTITNLSSEFVLATTSSLATHTIGGNLTISSDRFCVSNGSGSPTLTVEGNIVLSGFSANFIVSNSTGSPTVNVDGNVSINFGTFTVCNSTGSASVLMGSLSLSSFFSYFRVKANVTSSSSPSVTINGNLGMSGGTFDCNRSTGGNPTILITGNVTFSSANTSEFHGTSNTGSSNVTIEGNLDMTAGTNSGNVVHVSNDQDGGTSAVIGDVTMTIKGSVLLGAYGHLDLSFNGYGGNNTVNVYGSAYGTANTIRFAGTHGYNRSDCLAKLVFKSPASGSASGILSMTTGDYDGNSIDSRFGIGQFNVEIEASREITLQSDIELGTNRYFTVHPGGTLITGTPGGTAYKVARRAGGGGYASNTTFTLSPASGSLYAELQANATPDALVKPATGFAGNIQTDNRVYSSAANYRFNASASQSTGDFLDVTTPSANTVNKLTVNNLAGVPTGLTLSRPVTIRSELSLLAGRLISTSVNLPLVEAAGTVTGYGSTPANTIYVDGPLAKELNGTASFLFPVGKSSGGGIYRPAALQPPGTAPVTYQAELMYGNPSSGGYSTSSHVNPVKWVQPNFYWNLLRTSATNVDARVELFYTGPDTNSTFPTLSVGSWNTTASAWEQSNSSANSTSSLRSFLTGSAITLPVSTGSPFALVGWNSPLPVELLSFKGRKDVGFNVLEWSTASEINNSHFEVTRSTNGLIFYSIGRVKGAGNSVGERKYTFTDIHPPRENIVYYRLKQVDSDGQYQHSNSIVLDGANPGDMLSALYPSPAVHSLNYTLTIPELFTDHHITVEIVDVLGHISHEASYEVSPGQQQAMQADVSQLAKGIYFIRVRDSSKIIDLRKFVKS